MTNSSTDGRFITDRAVFQSDIWYNIVEFRLFFFLYGNAVYQKSGLNYMGFNLKRGQYIRSYRNLQKDLEYVENRTVKRYSISTIKKAIDSLIKQNRIKKKDTELGTLFTIINYNYYQQFTKPKTNNAEQRANKSRTESEQIPNRERTNPEQEEESKESKESKEINNIPKNEFSGDSGQNNLNKNSKDYLSELENAFKEEYRKSRGFEYDTATVGKDKKALGTLAKKYKDKYPEQDTKQALQGLQSFFAKCMNIEDKFIRENMSPMFIVSQMHKINSILNSKGGANNGTTIKLMSEEEQRDYFRKNGIISTA